MRGGINRIRCRRLPFPRQLAYHDPAWGNHDLRLLRCGGVGSESYVLRSLRKSSGACAAGSSRASESRLKRSLWRSWLASHPVHLPCCRDSPADRIQLEQAVRVSRLTVPLVLIDSQHRHGSVRLLRRNLVMDHPLKCGTDCQGLLHRGDGDAVPLWGSIIN